MSPKRAVAGHQTQRRCWYSDQRQQPPTGVPGPSTGRTAGKISRLTKKKLEMRVKQPSDEPSATALETQREAFWAKKKRTDCTKNSKVKTGLVLGTVNCGQVVMSLRNAGSFDSAKRQ